MYSKPLRRQRGLTIVELIMFMVIVGVAAAGIIQVLSLTNRASTDPIRRKQAMLIAEAYMEEVQQTPMTFCDGADTNLTTATSANQCVTQDVVGREDGNTRPFDNVNDYVTKEDGLGTPVRAFAVADASGTLVDRDVAGNPLGVDAAGGTLGNVSMRGITTTLTLNAIPANAPLGPAGNGISDPSGLLALRITITVTYGPGPNDVITLDGYRTRYAPNTK